MEEVEEEEEEEEEKGEEKEEEEKEEEEEEEEEEKQKTSAPSSQHQWPWVLTIPTYSSQELPTFHDLTTKLRLASSAVGCGAALA